MNQFPVCRFMGGMGLVVVRAPVRRLYILGISDELGGEAALDEISAMVDAGITYRQLHPPTPLRDLVGMAPVNALEDFCNGKQI